MWMPPPLAAVYSITYKQDPENKPKYHTVLYFGETSDLSQEVGAIKQVLSDSVDMQFYPDELFVFVHPMPGSTRFERSEIQSALVRDYRPRGNGY